MPLSNYPMAAQAGFYNKISDENNALGWLGGGSTIRFHDNTCKK